MAKSTFTQTYYQPMQKRGNTLLAVGGFLLMVGVAYFIYKKVKKGTQVKGSVKSSVPNLPIWSEIKIFDPTTSKVSVKGKTNYYSSVGVGGYVGEATGKIEKGSDGLYYRELVPPTDRKDMFKNSSGTIINKAYVLAKVTEGFK
jgi:hypothetical protein